MARLSYPSRPFSNHPPPSPPLPSLACQNPYVPTFLHCARPRASPPPTDGPSKPAPTKPPAAPSLTPASGKGRAMGPWAAAVRAGVAFKLAVAYALYVRHTATCLLFPCHVAMDFPGYKGRRDTIVVGPFHFRPQQRERSSFMKQCLDHVVLLQVNWQACVVLPCHWRAGGSPLPSPPLLSAKQWPNAVDW